MARHASRRRGGGLVLWTGVIVLALVGVAAAIGRAVFLTDASARAAPLREDLLRSLHRVDPRATERGQELAEFDRRFAAHPGLTLLHVIPGGLFLALAPFQFSSAIRARHIRFHRWSGRALMAVGLASAASALYFGLLIPFGGPGEAAAIALFGGLFLVAMTRAFLAIRRGDVARHREWMIRAFAVAIAISTIRVLGAALDIAVAPLGLRAADAFVVDLWLGWVITVGAAELWIRHTRAGSPLVATPVR